MDARPGAPALDGAELFILDSLVDGPKHGYLMTTDIAARHGRRLGPGTLYAAIARLEHDGHIRPLEPVDRRQPYRITDQGAAVLDARLRELARMASDGLARLDARAS
jgi:DNA-binding PadR family transcriptional regulator